MKLTKREKKKRGKKKKRLNQVFLILFFRNTRCDTEVCQMKVRDESGIEHDVRELVGSVLKLSRRNVVNEQQRVSTNFAFSL